MARVTVEDCVDKVENRFELVLIASHRARGIAAGAPIMVDRDNDKNPVIALREIAESALVPEDLKEDFIQSLQKQVEVDEPEAETVPALSSTLEGSDAVGEFDRMTEEDSVARARGSRPARRPRGRGRLNLGGGGNVTRSGWQGNAILPKAWPDPASCGLLGPDHAIK